MANACRLARPERSGSCALFAQTADDAVKAVIASGQTARVIMQFATTAERDAAFNRLLDRAPLFAPSIPGRGRACRVRQRRSFRDEIVRRHMVSLDAGVGVRAGSRRATVGAKSGQLGQRAGGRHFA